MKTEEAEAVNLQAEEERALKKIRDHNMKKCKSLQMLKVNTMVCLFFELVMLNMINYPLTNEVAKGYSNATFLPSFLPSVRPSVTSL